MQESRQTQQTDPRLVMDFMEDAIVCDICGDAGDEALLAICNKCQDGAEHIYCMRVILSKLPTSDWMCEECMVRSYLPAKRCGAPLKAQLVKRGRFIGVNAMSPKSSNPCYNSCKNFRNGKVKATKSLISQLQMSCNSQEKAKAPCACVDEGKKHILDAGSDKKKRDLKARFTFPEASKPSNKYLISRRHLFESSGKAKLEAGRSVSIVKQSSSGFQKKPELPKLCTQTKIAHNKCSLLKSGSFKTGDLRVKEGMGKGCCSEKHKVERYLAFDEIRKAKNARVVSKAVSFNSVSSEKLSATFSEVILESAYRHHVVYKNSSSSEWTNTTRGKRVSKSDNPAVCFSASYSSATAAKSGNKTIFPDETFSGSSCSRLDVVHSSFHHKDQNGMHEENKNESQETEQRAEYVESVIPEFAYIWLGNFEIQTREGIACIYDGLQAHLSTCASRKVLEVVDKLPEIVVLEELPRLRMWPSQFVERKAAEENIALYFFAQDDTSNARYKKLMKHMTKNDLALKGNFDGVELLIFPSNVLPQKSQRWNDVFFFWGVFRGRKVKNSTNTPESSSEKQESRDVSSGALDHNAYCENDDDDGYVADKEDEDVQGEPSRQPFLSLVSPTISCVNVDLLDQQAANTLVWLSKGFSRRFPMAPTKMALNYS